MLVGSPVVAAIGSLVDLGLLLNGCVLAALSSATLVGEREAREGNTVRRPVVSITHYKCFCYKMHWMGVAA